MISTEVATRQTIKTAIPKTDGKRKPAGLHRVAWLCLVLACLGASWFTYQWLLVPQPVTFAPDWAGAQWISAADGAGPVAYFRYTTTLSVPPDGAFVTVAASQIFRLYVNGTLVGSNTHDFAWGDYPRAYIYDIATLLEPGPNVIALRVSNVDTRAPLVRASIGIVEGATIAYHVTGDGWQATAQSTLVFAHTVPGPDRVNKWITTGFDASSWRPALHAPDPAGTPMLTVNPLLYERPAATQWISTGAGHDAYFVRQFAVPFLYTNAWLRLAATGTASIFINGHLLITWNGAAIIPAQSVADYLSDDETIVQYRSGLALGVYNITPYLHAGSNTLAVHVSAPGTSAAQVGLETLNAAMSADVLLNDVLGHNTWLSVDNGWRASPHSAYGWSSGADPAWPSPLLVGRPGAVHTFYLQDSATPRNQQFLPFLLIFWAMLFTVGAVLGLWLLAALVLLRRYYTSRRAALEATALAYLPALALEGLLLALTREPLLPQPFPYSWQWAVALVCMVGVGYLLLRRNAVATARGNMPEHRHDAHKGRHYISADPSPHSPAGIRFPHVEKVLFRLWAVLREHWVMVGICLVALPMISYNLGYEPYWQDELTSFFAAKGVLAHGLPVLSSGFLYPKGELYSYLLALSMLIFGDHGAGPRVLSVLEYLVSLPLFYAIGCYFFEKRIALLATAMLAFSPITLLWGRQVRMYEQAQLCTLLTAYLFYRALDMGESMSPARRKRYIYGAMLGVIATYLSHEETFIIFPALLCYALGTWYVRRARHKNGGASLPALAPALSPRKHWLLATLIMVSVVSAQLLVVRFSHPPLLGTDQSQRPLISLTSGNIPYYIDLMFFPGVLGRSTFPWITLNSVLAVMGCVWAIRRRNTRAAYCAWFLCLSFGTLMLTFTLTSDRYIYPVLPIYYLVGAYALFQVLYGLWGFACVRLMPSTSHQSRDVTTPGRGQAQPLPYTKQPTNPHRVGAGLAPALVGYLAWPVRIMVTLITLLVLATTLILPVLPVSGYNLFISREVGLAYHRHYADYDAVGMYMQQHWQKGDIVISVSPAISILYYVGHVNYFFSLDRALYLFEKDGHIIDTPTGSVALLDQQDFLAVIAAHTRVWIISDNGVYQSETAKRISLPLDFHVVFEGYGSAIYFRGG